MRVVLNVVVRRPRRLNPRLCQPNAPMPQCPLALCGHRSLHDPLCRPLRFPRSHRLVVGRSVGWGSQIAGLKEVVLIGFYEPALFEAFITEASARFSVPIKYARSLRSSHTHT